ncbi:ROK family protein [Paenibacillus puldeungensis]|uniref:ROK family protein n=1 Tax=Paenibacillus puldeungensis TaxID=696536 RepID=A0ABW3S1Z8_9BACL
MSHQESVAIGIDLGGTNIKAGIVNDRGEVVYRLVLPTEAYLGGEALLQRVISIVEQLSDEARKRGWSLIGTGIGTAGQVNHAEGVVMGATANLPGWAGMKLGEQLHASTGLPVSVDNDANAMAFGEAWVGSGRNWRNFVCVTLGTGVGGCLIVDGKPYRGRSGYAGEVGHHVIVDGGEPCNCGRTGCWEQYASVTGLMRMARQVDPEAKELVSSKAVFSLAREDHKLASVLVRQYARYIAIGLANLIHIFNPEGIVVGGAITKQGNFLLDIVREELASSLLPVYRNSPETIDVVAAMLEDDGGVIGAAADIFEKMK